MAERKGRFLSVAIGCMALAFAAGFAIALFSIGRANILYRFAVPWELCQAVLHLAAWTPAILLVASALAFEGGVEGGFTGAAGRTLVPALVMAAIVSIFYLLVVPGIRERSTWYERSSAQFNDSLLEARHAMENGRLQEAERLLLICRAISDDDERFVALYDEVQAAFVRAASQDEEAAPATAPSEDPVWKLANRFYLEALQAREEGRLFDAHYLAKRSVAVYSKRPEVRRLVEETWSDLQKLGPSQEELASAAFYRRKLDGYALLQEKDYLGAFRLFSELAADDRADQDVSNYLELSREGLESVAFWIEEDRHAFSGSDLGAFEFTVVGASGEWRLRADRCAVSADGIFFRNLALEWTGADPVSIVAPFARLRGKTMVLRAVDRAVPSLVWEPVYGRGAAGALGPYAVGLTFDERDVEDKIRLSGPAPDIPLALLATGMGKAREFGLDTAPLRAELGARISYPFVVVMLILLGAALGLRFKAVEAPGTLATYLSAPFFVGLSLPPLALAEGAGRFAVSLMAESLPGGFIPAWLGFLALVTAISVFISARVALHAPR